MDSHQIAQKIFSKPVKPANSCSFQVDSGMTTKDIFEMLLEIFTEGMKVLYGNAEGKVDLNSLEAKDMEKVQEYFASLGFQCRYKIYPITAGRRIDFESMKYTNHTITDKTPLKTLKFPIRVGPRVYVISFDYVPPS